VQLTPLARLVGWARFIRQNASACWRRDHPQPPSARANPTLLTLQGSAARALPGSCLVPPSSTLHTPASGAADAWAFGPRQVGRPDNSDTEPMQAIDTCDPVDCLSGAKRGRGKARSDHRLQGALEFRHTAISSTQSWRSSPGRSCRRGHRARAGVVVHRAAVGGVVQHAPAARREDHAAGEDPRGDGRLHDLTHLGPCSASGCAPSFD